MAEGRAEAEAVQGVRAPLTRGLVMASNICSQDLGDEGMATNGMMAIRV